MNSKPPTDGRRRLKRNAKSRLLMAALATLFTATFAGASVADDKDAWAAALKHLTPTQGRTLLHLTRDFFQHEELADSHYTRCIDPYDAAASDPQTKETIDESLKLVEGASRRMGYTAYTEISDDYERLRLAKMLAEGRWLRQFKKGVQQCLYGQAEVKAKLKGSAD